VHRLAVGSLLKTSTWAPSSIFERRLPQHVVSQTQLRRRLTHTYFHENIKRHNYYPLSWMSPTDKGPKRIRHACSRCRRQKLRVGPGSEPVLKIARELVQADSAIVLLTASAAAIVRPRTPLPPLCKGRCGMHRGHRENMVSLPSFLNKVSSSTDGVHVVLCTGGQTDPTARHTNHDTRRCNDQGTDRRRL
jgi:hypothetical protein